MAIFEVDRVRVGIAEAKNKLPKLIRIAETGEVVTILRHGHPVVELRRLHPRPRRRGGGSVRRSPLRTGTYFVATGGRNGRHKSGMMGIARMILVGDDRRDKSKLHDNPAISDRL
jgi:antitoxin (DNA-binding transcriptional repressor) of toxin-antitoxin stability system